MLKGLSINFNIGGLVLGYVTLVFRAIILICMLLALMMIYLLSTMNIRIPDYGSYEGYFDFLSFNRFTIVNFAIATFFACGTISSICFVIGIHKKISKLLIPYLVIDTLYTPWITYYVIQLAVYDIYNLPVSFVICGERNKYKYILFMIKKVLLTKISY